MTQVLPHFLFIIKSIFNACLEIGIPSIFCPSTEFIETLTPYPIEHFKDFSEALIDSNNSEKFIIIHNKKIHYCEFFQKLWS